MDLSMIPLVTLRIILATHLLCLFLALYEAGEIGQSWFYSNFLVVLVLFRLVDAEDATAHASVAEVGVYLYIFTIANDIVQFVRKPACPMDCGWQNFSLAWACILLITKPFFVPTLLADLGTRGGALGSLLSKGMDGATRAAYQQVSNVPAAAAGAAAAAAPYQDVPAYDPNQFNTAV